MLDSIYAQDRLCFSNMQLFNLNKPNITQREVLKQSSRVYDPLGFLTPISITAKLIMQELWKNKFAWDEPLPMEIQSHWVDLATDLEYDTIWTSLDDFSLNQTAQILTILFIQFVDAIPNAYGAVTYICNGSQF